MAKSIHYEKSSPESNSRLPKLKVTDPEYSISLVGLVMSIAGQPIVGLILGVIALRQSRAAGRNNTFALLGIIFGIVFTLVILLVVAAYITIAALLYMGHGQGTF